MGDFRFGVNMLSLGSRAEWIEKCRRAEELGFDVIGVPDHLGLPSPLPAMVLAAAVTERVRVNSFVLNVPFYNPVLLAREVATVDRLTDGRAEIGLGAGYVKAEFEAAGIAFPTARQRVEAVAETALTFRKLFGDSEYEPQPVQPGGPPLLIAGWGQRLLRVAAEHADVIAFTGGGTDDSGHLTGAGPQELAQKVQYVRELLGPRRDRVEFNLLIQALAAPQERPILRERMSDHLPPELADRLEEVPMLLVGDHAEMAETVRARRERFGIGYLTVLEPNMEKFAPLIPLLRS
ncbi:TIGR03621 family F420-dependent LLM class oxidoreductase [Nocardia sp. alder85J]|uniref:TIGR03621 family F420-dependent LLM class oxidoreductase n=1 Tax=Nocardia sp. alder85J TaxID=2862949 RepID=UPI001CD4618B|nr:TIGR03621 family F420-dependent LLM class oxidoreductase [Nocardia sp. alder85J]MCX4097969.1 TIGR03621 family F420-dependent LLM class oxidoreductase [Nocardia sp. alder85J]